jgi:uncharacterized protein (DUF58 family)
MLAYPSPRTATGALMLLGLATAGYFVPQCFDLAILLAVAGLVVVLTDLSLTTRALRGKLSLERDFPAAETVARPRRGRYIVRNDSALALKCRVYPDTDPDLELTVPEKWQRVRSRESLDIPARFTINVRGEVDIGGAGLRMLAGIGLWVLQYRFDWDVKLKVYPLIEELTRGDLFAHRRRLWGIGQHQSKKFGRGTEFDSLREYNPGDEYRSVNWKATARAGRPIINQYQVEQSRDLMLLIDCGRLMHTEIEGRPRLDRYLDAAVHLAYLALSQKDRVGLIAFDSEVTRFIAPNRSARQLDNVIDAVFDLKPRFIESDYAQAVTTLKARSPKRGLVVLFTDLVDSVSSKRAVANLSRLARTHLPVIVILDDPAVPELALAPAGRLTDAYVKGAAAQFVAEKKRTLTQLRTRGCIIVNTAAVKLNATLVNEYLSIKARNLL